MDTKVIIGKDDYLFLQNDSSKSLEKHNKSYIPNLCIFNLEIRYNAYKNQLLFVIFPDKEVICKDFLPDHITCNSRPYTEIYKRYLNENLIDGGNILDISDYYKTDTHINNKGGLKIYNSIIDYLNKKFNVTITTNKFTIIENTVASLSELNKGIGDLTWEHNKGNLEVNTIDKYYSIEPSINFYISMYDITDNYSILDYNLNDVSKDWINKLIDWDCVSKNIFYKKNLEYSIHKKVLIFYDSFLLNTIKLYKDIFKEIYLAKAIFNSDLIDMIKPDFIIEARVERFLFA